MRILVATHYFASHRGGIEIVAEELCRQLEALGQEVVWIATDATPAAPAGASRGVSLHASNFVEQKLGVPVPIPTVRALKTIYKEVNRAQIVVLHDCLYLSNIAAFVFARFRRVPVIIVQHTIPNERGVFNFLMKLATAGITRPMLSRADQVVFVSCTTRNFHAGVSLRTPAEVIFNGVDTDVFSPLRGTATKAQLRRKLGLAEDRPVILFVGRFVEKKGLPVLRRMVGLRQDYTWAFAGWGQLDPNTWNASNVRVFSGLQGHSLAELYRASDVLVLPSTGEGFPLVIQESLASGLPVVCGAETMAADPAMQAFVRGVIVHPGDDERTASEFVAAIDEIISSRAEVENQSENRHAFAAARYSWRRAAERYLEIASRLVMLRAPSQPAGAVSSSNRVLPAATAEEQNLNKVLR